MKYQKDHKPLDERDKLRQFRELDDAFANALRELENPKNAFNIPTGPPVRSLAALEEEEQKAREQEREEAREQESAAVFRERFHALLAESPISQAQLLALIETLLRTGHWKERQVPKAKAGLASTKGEDVKN
ncbi:hypothetical protein [Halomonas llamarensis]|uniref:Uncharacterized protein n=1 Tax=Halomonas llamarensis TaxID=2945104 RepID=A0ABT0SMM0_9GAMM|nr:hypothetical protein [Halomonas llamarensis]MCL7929049.1 hypothetical protein [Halomonas llamarensis]